jgi:uncharacterized protein
MPPSSSELLDIEVAYATWERECIVALRLPRGASAHEAIVQSGVLEHVPEIDLAQNKIGVYGKIVGLDYILRQHDRVEIYRPLTIDPKEIRRLRANKAK